MERTFRKDLSSLEAIDGFVRSFASGHGLDDETVFTLNFVIEEIFTNMVKYQPAGKSDASVALSLDGRLLTVRLTDHGVEYFDPTARPAVDTGRPIEERTPGGLGVHLVRQYMDGFEYEYAGGNSIITLTKTLRG